MLLLTVSAVQAAQGERSAQNFEKQNTRGHRRRRALICPLRGLERRGALGQRIFLGGRPQVRRKNGSASWRFRSRRHAHQHGKGARR